MWIQFIIVITADIILEINKEIKKNKKKGKPTDFTLTTTNHFSL